jgi:beta-galactosidase
VQFPAVRDPLSAGLSLSDVVMTTGERIARSKRDEWPSDDGFKYILDLDDIAPFSTFPGPAHWNDPDTTGPGSDTWPMNMVNGFLSDTTWRLIFSIHLERGDPTSWTTTLPREETITGIAIAPNKIYHQVTGIKLTFNDNPATAQEFELDPEQQTIELEVEPARAKTITVDLTKWEQSGRKDVIGVDNLWIRVKRPDDFGQRVKPLLNIGGLIKYPRGKGGILLSQYQFLENEANPANAGKKATVLATLLRNLGAVFSGGGTLVAGHNLQYSPVSLEDYCNLYLSSSENWPDKQQDLSALPLGDQTFAGVKFAIRDFETSPLENAVALKCSKPKIRIEAGAVEGIKVDRRADAVFFLHTCLQGRAWEPGKRNTTPPVIFRYVIHYADGTSEQVDVMQGLGVTNWLLSEKPSSLRDAAVAWTAPVDDEGSSHAVVYQQQWNNPHPDKVIKSIDLVYGDSGHRWGAPVLLGITTATKIE